MYRVVTRPPSGGSAGDAVDVVPEVAALRARAEQVVAAELRRLRRRRPELSEEQDADVAQTLGRVVRRLLHHPTVLVCRTAGEADGERYAALLLELFELKPPRPSRVGALPEGRTGLCVRPDPRSTHGGAGRVSSTGGRLSGAAPDTITNA